MADRLDNDAPSPDDAPSLEEVDAQIDKARHALDDIEGKGEGRSFIQKGEADESDDATDDTVAPPG